MQSKQHFARVAAGRMGFLTALGIDLDREERRATPVRMARVTRNCFPNVRSGSGSRACRRNQQ
jgi:GTP cyclohydrolase I